MLQPRPSGLQHPGGRVTDPFGREGGRTVVLTALLNINVIVAGRALLVYVY